MESREPLTSGASPFDQTMVGRAMKLPIDAPTVSSVPMLLAPAFWNTSVASNFTQSVVPSAVRSTGSSVGELRLITAARV